MATFTVRGHKVRSASQRRYIVVAVRPEPYVSEHSGTHATFTRIIKRSDNLATANKAVEKYGCLFGAFAVIIDSVTGEEI